MDTYFVYILLCIVQRCSVNGQMLVSHKEGVIVSSSSQIIGDNRYDIEHAVDENADTDAGSCSCCGATQEESSPWFKVDLIQEYMIQRIHIQGRTDYPHTLNKLEIQLGTTDSNGAVLHVDTSVTDIDELDYTLTSPEPARYITLTLRDRTEHLVICELYVYAVCTEGTYGPECVKTCGKCQNNEPCDGVTGACSGCMAGYQSLLCNDCIAGRYGSTCELCGQCNNNDVCDKINGNCPNGCSAGYKGNTCKQECSLGKYGPDCSETCGKCENIATCNNANGFCASCVNGYLSPMCKECSLGKYGQDCSETCVCRDGRYGSTCNENCGHCTNTDVCDKSNGHCPNRCSSGYKGTTCKEVCKWGTYGMDCANTCGKCENTATCNNVDGTCTTCLPGYLSPMCKDCKDGRYGPTCNEVCGHCYNNYTCDKSNGYCPSGCSAGYQGNTCKEVCNPGTYGIKCSKTCGRCENNAACNNLDGACIACLTGYLSPICKECIDGRYGTVCNEACGQCNNSDACDKTNANCPNGCSAGFQGIMCKEECEDDTFGLGCQEKCGNCSNNETCNKIDGVCTACAAGYKGHTCVVECQAGTFGFNCKQRCGMCLDGDVCNIYTGECPNGCTDEYKGSQCFQKINQDTSPCSDTCISLPVFMGSLFAVIVVTITIVIGLGWLFYRKRLNKKTHKAANNEDTSIPLPNTPSNYDTLKFDNPNGESTYTELNRRS